uniref:Uncharacterized protein n=1 Tax=Glossina morsitans morsitans TaxID=37546 RepID=A0A1B0FGK5_GLOMM
MKNTEWEILYEVKCYIETGPSLSDADLNEALKAIECKNINHFVVETNKRCTLKRLVLAKSSQFLQSCCTIA